MRQRMATTKSFECCSSTMRMLTLRTRRAWPQSTRHFCFTVTPKVTVPRSYDYYWSVARIRTLGIASSRVTTLQPEVGCACGVAWRTGAGKGSTPHGSNCRSVIYARGYKGEKVLLSFDCASVHRQFGILVSKLLPFYAVLCRFPVSGNWAARKLGPHYVIY